MFNREVKLFLVAAAAASLLATPTFAGSAQNDTPFAIGSVVRTDGKVLGTDPDMRIRFELWRDAYADEN